MKGIKGIASLVAVLVLSTVVLLIFKKKIGSWVDSAKNRAKIKDERKFLEDLGMKLSYPENWYTSKVQKLYEAVRTGTLDWNCDETATQQILMSLNNDLDYLELYLAFGIKETFDLTSWVYNCLNQSEINFVNSNWKSKGITKTL